jgi:DNA-3-methyladenine glycosylase II
MSATLDPYEKARRHLARRDPVLKRIIAAVGRCTLQPNPDGFTVLVRSVVSQLISTAAARTIGDRLLERLAPHGGLTPSGVLALPEESLRGAGLSGVKVRSIRGIAAAALDGSLPLDRFDELDDATATAALTRLHGIGAWTAQMFLIFSLGRLDVLPTADLGLRAGVKDQFGLDALPAAAHLTQLAEGWRPYRTVATWYFWRSRGFVPQSQAVAPDSRPGANE